MKFMHLADLHIGKRVNEFSMIEDQKFIFNQILTIMKENEVDAVCIAGDVYDKSQPTIEAVELFDDFLTRLAKEGKPILLISGNHDSPERLDFGKNLLLKNNLYICGVFRGELEKISLEDEYGEVNFYLLPFIKPAMVRAQTELEVDSYDDAVRGVIDQANVDCNLRNILLAHQFVIGGAQETQHSDSEILAVGGVDQINTANFDAFDYVALGHLHAPQRVGREEVRYAGSPLKYSASEVNQKKAVTIVDIKEKGDITISKIPLKPLHEMRRIKGPLAELINIGNQEMEGRDDYIHAVVTDEKEVYDAIGQLRQIYPNIMTLSFENSKTMKEMEFHDLSESEIAKKSMLELFQDFYQMQNQEDLTPEQTAFVETMIEEAGGLGE